jgi:hypothetical protein
LNLDTDGDGLSDGAEVLKYKTDPLNPDTDGDGHSDGKEVGLLCDPVQSGVCPPSVLSDTLFFSSRLLWIGAGVALVLALVVAYVSFTVIMVLKTANSVRNQYGFLPDDARVTDTYEFRKLIRWPLGRWWYIRVHSL